MTKGYTSKRINYYICLCGTTVLCYLIYLVVVGEAREINRSDLAKAEIAARINFHMDCEQLYQYLKASRAKVTDIVAQSDKNKAGESLDVIPSGISNVVKL